MNLNEFLEAMDLGQPAAKGTELRRKMTELREEAGKITTKLNGTYLEQGEIRSLFSELIGEPVDETFSLFPPFYTDCGKNIHIGKDVFINAGCHFQDQGGVFIGDGVMIGHNVVLATLNHGMRPEERGTVLPKPIRIGKNVWIGSNSVIISGVTIGDDAIVAAGAVVSHHVPKGAVVGGVPARVIGTVYEETEFQKKKA